MHCEPKLVAWYSFTVLSPGRALRWLVAPPGLFPPQPHTFSHWVPGDQLRDFSFFLVWLWGVVVERLFRAVEMLSQTSGLGKECALAGVRMPTHVPGPRFRL